MVKVYGTPPFICQGIENRAGGIKGAEKIQTNVAGPGELALLKTGQADWRLYS